MKIQKINFFNIFLSFLEKSIFRIFNINSKNNEFKFSKVFGTRSTFSVLFLKSLIFLIRGDVDKKNKKKLRRIKFTKKKEVEGPSLENIFAYKYWS